MDRPTVRLFFETWGPMVHRRARRILGNEADAEEAVQEVFIRALSGLEDFEGKSQISTWLYQITTNLCLNRIRNERRRRELWDVKVSPAEDRSSAPLAHADLLALRRVLTEADARESQAAVYVYLDGLSHEEAAELLGVSRRTVGNLLERFNDFARKLLSDRAPASGTRL